MEVYEILFGPDRVGRIELTCDTIKTRVQDLGLGLYCGLSFCITGQIRELIVIQRRETSPPPLRIRVQDADDLVCYCAEKEENLKSVVCKDLVAAVEYVKFYFTCNGDQQH